VGRGSPGLERRGRAQAANKAAPREKVAKVWAQEWAKEGKEVDWQRLMPPRGFRVLPRRWVVERTFAWITHNRRMSKDYERLCATSEAFIYVAMTRLMVRRLARAKQFSDTISRQSGE
jgi:transposase